jgi:hypothetical protein
MGSRELLVTLVGHDGLWILGMIPQRQEVKQETILLLPDISRLVVVSLQIALAHLIFTRLR